MSKQKTKSPSKLEKIVNHTYKNAQDRKKFRADWETLLTEERINFAHGYINQAGPNSDGTFQVSYVTGTTGYGTIWPEWAYKAGVEALLHGKQVTLAYTGSAPYGYNLVSVLIQDTAV